MAQIARPAKPFQNFQLPAAKEEARGGEGEGEGDMEAPINSYEDIRRKRVEENHKQLEGLGISRISKCLLEAAKTEYKLLKNHRSSNVKKLLETTELRRSSRMRNPVPLYRDDVVDNLIRPHGGRRSYKSEFIGREYTGRIPSYEEKVLALKRAEMLQSLLASNQPSFVKTMVRSHVSSCFWLGLPTKFCKDHLPHGVMTMVLEDEKGEEHESIYIGKRTGLSGGWKSFAVDHNLEDGDALVFKLIKSTRFKIYIVKAIGGSSEANDSNLLSKQVAEHESTELERNVRKRKKSRTRPSN
ncbi:B3 domain-containing protein Os05g0481400-like isoform X1 [Phalaenopsis equestris]|uniref:B3 domain-containing protein Os05g0481400-like isoform X1 n=1 Tax=Phalaenopsis equestris TaxID=78828 RepID=UPI0009E1E15C|nr:B3 domain-containing protein Os05g0481400-like isoform X1 [Phalaenopsis equestris]